MAYRRAQDTKGLRAVFYARVSTAEEEQLNAIELQIEENRNTITKHGWKKVDEYIDRSKSGTMVKGRDEYQRLYEDLLGDAFDVVVIKDQERLMRNTLDWYLFINRLVQTGKILYMYLEDKFYSPDDALITGIKAIIAEEFSRNLSKKLHNYHDGRIEKARQGLEIDLQGSGNVFGWDKVDGKYVINPEQAKVRRLMCEGIMARKGSTQIAKELNDAGYRNTVGKPWKPMDIPKFVYDCKNVGTMIINRERHDFESKQTVKLPESEWVYVKGALPPIVTEEEWALIEKIHEERVVATGCNRRGKKTSGYSFSGKLVCGVCGAPYWRKTKTSNEEYWVCSTKQQKGRKTRARDAVGGKAGEINPEGCDNENISYNALMEIMAIVSERLQADTGFIREFMLGRLDTYEKRITEANRGATEADLQREISRKDKLLDAYLDNLLTKEEYQRKALALDEHILELRREVEANKANLEDLVEIQRVRENIDAEVAQYLDENEQLKVEFVLEHLSQVIIYPDKVLVIFDVFGEGVMVEKSQYVSREKCRRSSAGSSACRSSCRSIHRRYTRLLRSIHARRRTAEASCAVSGCCRFRLAAHRHGSISNKVRCYKSLYCMVVSSKILLKKKQPTLIQYSLVQVYHKRGLIDSRYSVFFQEAAAACWITSSSRLSSGFPSCAKCSDTLIRTFPMTKYWVPSFSVSRVPLFLLLLSFLLFAIGSYLHK